MWVLFYTVLTIFFIVCLFLILLVLIQKGRGGGLASAFGGAGGHTAFGSKTGDVLTWATSIVFGIFLLLAVALTLLGNHLNAESELPDDKTTSADTGKDAGNGAGKTDPPSTPLPPLEPSDAGAAQ